MAFDFNNAGPQQDFSDLIPGGTIARVRMTIRRPEQSRAGDLPELTKSKTSDAQYIDSEFEILSEPLKGRKFWTNLMFANTTEGAINATRDRIRAMLESARGIKATDLSPLAMKARQIQSLSDLNGLEFVAKVGIEAGKNGYESKNKLQIAITPDMPEYASAFSGKTAVGTEKTKPAAMAPGVAAGKPTTPDWATAGPPAQQQPPAPAASPLPDWAR